MNDEGDNGINSYSIFDLGKNKRTAASHRMSVAVHHSQPNIAVFW
jgi:hypothetical protein